LGWPGIIDEISLTNNNTHVEMTGSPDKEFNWYKW
jgi:hypothetical protein